jgi:hypothetical protein
MGNMKASSRQVLALAMVVAASGCSGPAPVAVSPSGPSAPAEVAGATVRAQAEPRVVFKVFPSPNANGIIAGGSPFDVTFNVCRSEDPDGDRLFYTIDADGDGRIDESGIHGGNCRATFTYTAALDEFRKVTAEVCVVDLDGAGEPQRASTCRQYAVEIAGAPKPAFACARPNVGVTTWVGSGTAGPGQTCTCSLDGVVIPFAGANSYEEMCISYGHNLADWAPGPGLCNCAP